MSKKIYKHLGYFYTLNDIIRLCDKTADDVVDEYLKENGCFSDVDDSELDEDTLACYYPTFVKKNGKEYAVISDIDWDIKELESLDADSDEDNAIYDANTAYIDIYVLKETED